MRAFRNKKEFYDMLWADYQEYKTKVNQKEYSKERMRECFIYKYYLDKKTQKAKALAENADSFEKYFGNYAGKNAENKKRRCDKFILLCAAKQICGEDKDRFGEIFSKVTESENGGKHYTELFKTDSDQAYEELAYKFLCGTVQDMFLKKGYKQPKYDDEGKVIGNSAEPPQEISPKNSKDGYTDEIEMMYKFFANADIDSVSADSCAEISDEYIGKCEKMYGQLLENEIDSTNVFIPLYIDPSSGAGVYIIGDSHPKTGSKKCYVYILYFCDCDEYLSGEDAFGEKYETLYSQYEMKIFDSVREAFKAFSENVGGEVYYSNYNEYNHKILDRISDNEIDEHFIPLMISADALVKRKAERSEKHKKEMLAKENTAKEEYFSTQTK